MVDNSIIYIATSATSNKSYIGLTTQTIEKRAAKHKHRSLTAKENNHFHNAIRKYGWNDFEWKILYTGIPKDKIGLAEICAIYTYDTYYGGYNSTLGGEESPMKNPETARKVSISRKGKYKRFGKQNHFYGKTHTKETKNVIRLAKCKYVWEIIKPDGSVEAITNLKEYCDKNNLINSHMYAVALGKRKQHKGYKCKKKEIVKW